MERFGRGNASRACASPCALHPGAEMNSATVAEHPVELDPHMEPPSFCRASPRRMKKSNQVRFTGSCRDAPGRPRQPVSKNP